VRWDAPWFDRDPDEWLREVLRVHFDPDTGSPYWLQREKELGFPVRERITRVGDLALLGPMAQDDLASKPLELFLPKRWRDRKPELTIGETGGTTGKIQTTAYSREEFTFAFVDFLKWVFERRGFPSGLNWLYLGPSGPHIMFKNAQSLARAMGSLEPFAIDFDPRWVKKMERGSLGIERYEEHVVGQGERILGVQEIGLLFTTPVIALLLGRRISEGKRRAVRGIHLGGMTLTPSDYEAVGELYPNAVIVPGYGNTLCGVALEFRRNHGGGVNYFPPGPRLLLKVIPRENLPDAQRIAREVAYEERGQVMFHRLDDCFFIPNMIERDEAERVRPDEEWAALGFHLDGVRDPGPSREAAASVQGGLY
jgi:hypothetical protein